MTKPIEFHPFQGNSGMYHLFECWPVRSHSGKFPTFPDRPGVYIFAKRIEDNVTENSDYKVLYVGKAESFSKRPVGKKHEKWECATDHGVSHICIHKEKSDAKRSNIEIDIYYRHDPPCNDKKP